MRTLALAAAALLLAVPAASARHTTSPLANATGWTKAALASERAALAALNAQPPNWKEADKQATVSLLRLDAVSKNLANAPKVHELSSSTATAREDDVRAIEDHDARAIDSIRKKDEQMARTALLAAVSAKQALITQLVDDAAAARKQCTAEKPFDIFAVPAGYAGAYADVFPHGVPRDAKNIRVHFIDLATGNPAPSEVFPGQTWTSKVVGFLPDGRLHVHLDVSGTGIGKPDENSKHWKVVVTYDC